MRGAPSLLKLSLNQLLLSLKKKGSKKVAERIEDGGGEEPIERQVVVLYMCGVRPTPSTGSSSLPVQG